MTEYELHTQGASQPSAVTRYSLQTDYANGVGIPAMMESPTGDYVLYSHVRALELHNDMLLTMRKAADQRLAEALAQIEAIGAGGVSMMGDAKDAEILRLRYALRDLLESHAVPSTACKERAAYEKAVVALTQQEQV